MEKYRYFRHNPPASRLHARKLQSPATRSVLSMFRKHLHSSARRARHPSAACVYTMADINNTTCRVSPACVRVKRYVIRGILPCHLFVAQRNKDCFLSRGTILTFIKPRHVMTNRTQSIEALFARFYIGAECLRVSTKTIMYPRRVERPVGALCGDFRNGCKLGVMLADTYALHTDCPLV